MDRSEIARIKQESGRLRPTRPRVAQLDYATLADVEAEGVGGEFVWCEQTEAAFLTLLSSGHTISQICGQSRPGWPTYRDYLRKVGQDTLFKTKVSGTKLARAAALADRAVQVAENTQESSVRGDKLYVETALRVAASLDPESWGARQQVGVSGGLILAAGSLAELAAMAASRNTNPENRDTIGTKTSADGPLPEGGRSDIQQIQALGAEANGS